MDRAFVITHKTESTFGSDDGKISSSEEKSVENELLQKEDNMEDAIALCSGTIPNFANEMVNRQIPIEENCHS